MVEPNREFLLPQQLRTAIRHLKKNVEGYKGDHIFGVLLLTIGWNNNQTFVKGLHVAPTANIAYLNKKQYVEKLK